MKKTTISVHIWTERFLGSREKATSFLSMLRALDDGNWFPDRWGQFEPIKHVLAAEQEERLVEDWTEERNGKIANSIYFKKQKPSLFLCVTNWRGRVPDLNYVWFDIDAAEFANLGGAERLKNIVADFVVWSGAAYATAWHSSQHHFRSAPGNPTRRLDQLNWLTYFGTPYLRLLGEEKVRECPFYSCEAVSDGLLLTAAESPDSLTMSTSDGVLLSLEKCVGADIFANEAYPQIACRVPAFDLNETVRSEEGQ